MSHAISPMLDMMHGLQLPLITKRLLMHRAANGKLDGDMSTLDIDTLFQHALAISRGMELLFFEKPEYAIDAIIHLYDEYNEGDHISLIDHKLPEYVRPIEIAENVFNHQDFLEYIGMI